MNLNIMKEETLKSVLDKTQQIAAYTEIIARGKGVDSWDAVQVWVQNGMAKNKYPVGYEFTTTDADTGNEVVWVVRDHDHHKKAGDPNAHTMTLEMKYVYSLADGTYQPVQFDNTEAFHYSASGMAAGTYNFSCPATGAWQEADNGKTFQFTLTQAVPAGGQLLNTMRYSTLAQGNWIYSYASGSSTTYIESVPISEGSEGTSLGTMDGDSATLNHNHRIRWGSNNYAQSALRQWLNSSNAAGNVWTPVSIFDRAPSWATTYNGFMHSLPADFLAVVQPAVVECRTNSLFENPSLDGTTYTKDSLYEITTDKFFLLSRPEIFGDWDSTALKDGTILDYYDGLTATERIKYDMGDTARYAWLRSPYPGDAVRVRSVTPAGTLSGGNASYAYGVAPACIIA